MENRWLPQIGEKYFYPYVDRVEYNTRKSEDDKYLQWQLKTTGVFATEEEAHNKLHEFMGGHHHESEEK